MNRNNYIDIEETTTDKLVELVKHITETGEWVLEKKDLKTIKSYCKQSDHNVTIVYELIMAQLKKRHAQIRYSSLQLIEQIFDRSKLFRDLLTEDFPVFIQLAVGIQGKKLPPPVNVATKLKQYALALMKAWYAKFGEKYRQLSIAFDFLMDQGHLNNEVSLLSTIHANDQSRSSTDNRRKVIQLNRYELLKGDIDDHIDIIQDNLTNMQGCFEILIPKNDFLHDDIDFDALLRGEASNTIKPQDTYKETMLSHGLGSNRYKITVNLSEKDIMEDVQETDENHIIFDQLREAYTVLEHKHMDQLNGWINALVKIEITDEAEKEKLVTTLINLKVRATEEVRKAKVLGIQVLPRRYSVPHNNIEDEEEDEYMYEMFEDIEVPDSVIEDKKSISKMTPTSSKLPPLQRIFPLSFEPHMVEDATYSGPKIADTGVSAKDKGKNKMDPESEELLKRAPVVEWGEDLYYWDKKNVQFNTSGIEKSHRFMGVGEGDNEMPEQLLDELRKRTIYYKSEMPKNIPACKYPLKNGGLCPRKDLVTCPFHGKIIARNDRGQPTNPEDIAAAAAAASSSEATTKVQPSVMDNLWELIEGDVVDPSGKPLITASKKVEKKKKSALINIKKKPSSSYTRLNKQMNSPRTKKMVENALEYEREMKSRNKEANNWR